MKIEVISPPREAFSAASLAIDYLYLIADLPCRKQRATFSLENFPVSTFLLVSFVSWPSKDDIASHIPLKCP